MLQKLKDSVDEKLDEPTEDMAKLMYNMALINSGFNLQEPSEFTNPLQRLINVGFGLERDAAVEEIEVDVSLDDDEENKDAEKETPADEEEINLDDVEVEDLSGND